MEETQIDYMMSTATFMVNMEASSSKTTFKGMFKIKCVLSPLEFINSDAMYRELLGKTNPQYANEHISQLCYALSQLKYRVIDAPDWFKKSTSGVTGGSVDDNILLFILDKAIDAEGKYREGIEERYKKARKEVREAIDSGELNANQEEEVVNDIDEEETEEVEENKLGE